MDKSSHNEMKRYEGSFWNFSDKNAAEIEREIQITRADLDETVTALQARLAPQNMLNQFLDNVRETMRDAAPRVADAIRRNPAPAGLVAIGLGWLFFQSVSPPRTRVRSYDESYLGTEDFSATELTDESGGMISDVQNWGESKGQKIKDSTRRMKDKAKDKASQLASATKEKAGEWAESTKDKASQLAGYTRDKASHLVDLTREKVSDVAGYTREKASDVADYTREKAGQVMHAANRGMHSLGHSAREGLDRTGETTVRLYKQNPLAFCLACLGVGAVVAMSLPISRKEQEVMGEASDSVVQKAKEAGQETWEKVQHIAEAGQHAVQEESRREGII